MTYSADLTSNDSSSHTQRKRFACFDLGELSCFGIGLLNRGDYDCEFVRGANAAWFIARLTPDSGTPQVLLSPKTPYRWFLEKPLTKTPPISRQLPKHRLE